MSQSKDSVTKENLIVIDTDFIEDYPPEYPLNLPLPAGVRVVFAEDIHPDCMPNLLKRAKIVLDLALPGAERLSGEGVLMGAIPIISNRWNGASSWDFPGIRKIDHQNGSEIFEALNEVMQNYNREITSVQNGKFFGYILSMWRRLHVTADVYFGSSSVHFILQANSLKEEYIANLQILGIYYLYPLASITLFVQDVKWYLRHHYSFFSLLQTSGYVRVDPFDPYQSHRWGTISGGQSYLNVFSANSLPADNTEWHSSTICPSWKPKLVVLGSGLIPVHSGVIQSLFSLTKTQRQDWNKVSPGAEIVSGDEMFKTPFGNLDGPIPQNFTSVCSLTILTTTEMPVVESGPHLSVFGIIGTLPWMESKLFIEQTYKISNLCN